MKIKYLLCLACNICAFVFYSNLTCFAQPSKHAADKKLLIEIDKSFSLAADQYKLMLQRVPADSFPKTFDPIKNQTENSNSEWWCSGFYPGTLLYLYEQTGNMYLYDEAIKKLAILNKEQFNSHTHDLGFMMYCSYGNANRIKHSAQYDTVLLNSAKSLATRFNPSVGCIKSWDGKPNEFLVIIDNMMNLELLTWATRVSGDSSFYKIAVIHANTTLKNHFRPDYSSYHVINYDATNGNVIAKKTAQGAADSSAWARGQAWGLYGFTMMYRETKDVQYLRQANAIASFILGHPDLPADKIPYWDFNAPGIPNALRDASAAAILTSALIELSGYAEKNMSERYLVTAEIILHSLLSENYTASKGTNAGFILKHGVGHKPQGTEVDMPLTYADYYFVEAMVRYRSLYK